MLLKRAKAYSNEKIYDKAIADINNVISFYARPGSHVELKKESLVEAYYRLGYNHGSRFDFKEASDAFKKGVAVGETLPGCRWTSYCYSIWAYITSASGEYQRATELAEQGMLRGKTANDVDGYLENWYEKVRGLCEIEENSTAETEVVAAIAFARQQPGQAFILAKLLLFQARLRSRRQDLTGVLRCLYEAKRLNEMEKDTEAICESYLNLGFYHLKFNKLIEAERYSKQALSFADNTYLRLRIQNNLGYIYQRQNQFLKALAAYQAGLSGILGTGAVSGIDKLPEPQLIRLVSHKEFIISMIQDKAETWLNFYKTSRNPAHLQQAMDTYQLADRMIDYMRWEQTGTLSKLYWRKKTRKLYEQAIEACYLSGNSQKAFYFFEKSRAVLLTDKLNELSARLQLTPEQATFEQELRERINYLQLKLFSVSPKSTAYQKTRTELMARQTEFEQVIKTIERSNPQYYRYKYDNTPPSLSKLQSYLTTQAASLLTYFVGDSALYVMKVTPTETKLIRRPVDQYAQSMQQFLPLLEKSSMQLSEYDAFLKASNSLYRQLLEPMLLPGGRVIVSPEGFFFPFDALSRSARQPQFLIDSYAFSYVYSASLLLKQKPVAVTGDQDFLGVAPVTFASSLGQPTLIGSDVALEQARRLFASSTLLTQQAATRQGFRQHAPTTRVVQLLTHADADSSGREPVLYFADSLLHLSELQAEQEFHTQLLVLSACKTGIGTNQQGEGVFSLARGFALLGIPSILTTLWSVENKPTYEITNLFFKHLADGLPKDLALQKAKQEFLATAGDERQLPYHWAGILLIGNPEPLHSSGNWMYLLPGLGIVLLLMGVWVYRKQRKQPQRPPAPAYVSFRGPLPTLVSGLQTAFQSLLPHIGRSRT
ncbi:hypothetical protein GCM10023187_32680 [Nibrella viscosa]|uniref:CHAT domain-containing protein n=1 Tax=Nibrella viscosa TaxID=1084524 RepID=A0ABP8KLF2_9BACT